MTNEAPWQKWRWVVHGHVEDDSVLQEYKYFKKRKLMNALAEINALSDLNIELIETREGSRRVKNLQFRVTKKEHYPEGVDGPARAANCIRSGTHD